MGKIAWNLFGGFCLVTGISGIPGDVYTWADWLAWVGSDGARWGLGIAGLAIIIGANHEYVWNVFFKNWLPMWEISLKCDGPFPFRKLIRLDKAAIRARDKCVNSGIHKYAVYGGKETTDPLVLLYYAAVIINKDEVRMYGSKTPTSKIEKMPQGLMAQYIFMNGGCEVGLGRDNISFYNVSILKTEFKERLKHMKAMTVAPILS